MPVRYRIIERSTGNLGSFVYADGTSSPSRMAPGSVSWVIYWPTTNLLNTFSTGFFEFTVIEPHVISGELLNVVLKDDSKLMLEAVKLPNLNTRSLDWLFCRALLIGSTAISPKLES